MITLTTPPQVNSVLGGSAPIAYNKLVVGPFTMNPSTMQINASLSLTSTGSPTMQAIPGTLTITTATATLEIAVERLDFYRRVTLTGPQNTAVMNIIRDAQNALESGLVSLGVIAGTQSLGA
jgi:hypothetical protein